MHHPNYSFKLCGPELQRKQFWFICISILVNSAHIIRRCDVNTAQPNNITTLIFFKIITLTYNFLSIAFFITLNGWLKVATLGQRSIVKEKGKIEKKIRVKGGRGAVLQQYTLIYPFNNLKIKGGQVPSYSKTLIEKSYNMIKRFISKFDNSKIIKWIDKFTSYHCPSLPPVNFTKD